MIENFAYEKNNERSFGNPHPLIYFSMHIPASDPEGLIFGEILQPMFFGLLCFLSTSKSC